MMVNYHDSCSVSPPVQVHEIKGDDVVCVVKNSATITGVLLTAHATRVHIDLPTLSDADKSYISTWGVKNGIDFLSLSFTRNAGDVRHVSWVLGFWFFILGFGFRVLGF